MARLFIGTLKGITFEWFMKLPAGSIKTRADLEKLFLACFFEDDTEVAMPTLLAMKQKKKRVYQRFCGENSEYDAPLSMWHIPVHAGRNIPPQLANCTPRLDRSSRMPHLKAVGTTRRTCRGNCRQGQG